MTDHIFLPGEDKPDKLLRYEAMNHAIGKLKKLQVRRKVESSVMLATISFELCLFDR